MIPGTATQESAWTVGRLLSWTTEHFRQNQIEDARLSAEVLLASALQRKRIELYTRFDEIPSEDVLQKYRDWVRRAAKHEPIAYLVAEKEFFSLPFYVTRDVLIPRPETEALVEAVIDHCKKIDHHSPQILDVGTGSGCIIISALRELPHASGVATDISFAALEIARRNAQRLNISDRLAFINADGLNFAATEHSSCPLGRFDVIVSNPPYIPAADIQSLKPEVREFEPRIALTDESDGLSFYRRLAVDCPGMLVPNGHIFVEIADRRGPAVIQTMAAACPKLAHRRTLKDRVTGLERVLVFSLD